MNDSFETLLDLIEQKKFIDAEIKLKDNKTIKLEQYYYLKGLLYNHSEYPSRSIEQAKRYFGLAIDSEYPIEDAFVKLMLLQDNTPHEIRILKKGIEHFPNSTQLYELSLYRLDYDESFNLIKEIENKGIESFQIIYQKIIVWFKKGYFSELPDIIDNTLTYNLNNKEVMFFELIGAFTYYELDKLDLSKKMFENLIEDDINHCLDFYQYFGLICCLLKENNYENALRVLDELKEDSEISLELFISMDVYSDWGLGDYVLYVLSELEQLTKKKLLIGKIKGIRALAQYIDYDPSANNSKVVSDLKYASKVFPKNAVFSVKLKNYYCEKNKFVECFNYHVRVIENGIDKAKIDRDNDYIENADDESFRQIVDLTKQHLSHEHFYRLDDFLRILVTPVISKLKNKNEFKEVIEISSQISKNQLVVDDQLLFDIAFSNSQINDLKKAEEYYLFYLNIFGDSSAVLNNLGLVYEQQGKLTTAREFFERALATGNNSKAKRSLNRVNQSIKQEKETVYKSIAKKISYSNLNDIGYNEELLNAIKRVTNKDLFGILERDIHENGIALLAGLNKMALIMSGSIIEALFLDSISSKGITSYTMENGKQKDVLQMDLNELLYIIDKERLLDKQLYHFSHALRGFRNLIHPGVEHRKKAVTVTSDDAKMAWEIMRKIIINF